MEVQWLGTAGFMRNGVTSQLIRELHKAYQFTGLFHNNRYAKVVVIVFWQPKVAR
jgi:hypothetical protein